jgi:hypothetical protein
MKKRRTFAFEFFTILLHNSKTLLRIVPIFGGCVAQFFDILKYGHITSTEIVKLAYPFGGMLGNCKIIELNGKGVECNLYVAVGLSDKGKTIRKLCKLYMRVADAKSRK